MEKNKQFSVLFLVAVVLCISTLGSVAAAEGVNNTTVISPNNNVNLNVSNDEGAKFDVYGNDTYNFFSPTQSSTQGQNELHISSSNSSSMTYGDVVATSNTTGTFYVTNTGGRGWNDDIILMIATNGTVTDNFNITIIVSGYTWAPVSSGSTPAYDALTYQWVALNETFTISDFVYGAQIWKPAPGTGNYATPIFYGQDMTNTNNSFYLMFVDLYAGILKYGLYSQQLIDNGALKVQYIINGLSDGQMTAFNVYGFSNSSNQGQGIRWTNRIVSTGSSAYSVTGATPVASFTATPTNGSAPLNVQFTDTSSNNPTSWAWDFDNDGIIDSTLQNPTWTYNNDGTYSVTLTATNSIGNNTITQTNLIKVGNPDLTISDVQLPTDPTIGGTYTINTTILNNGITDAGEFNVKFAGIGTQTIKNLAAGTSTILNWTWTPTTTGTNTININTDRYNTINENNENNNIYTQNITVTDPRPDITITDVQGIPTNPITGETYSFTTTITNNGNTDTGAFNVKITGIGTQRIDNLAAGASTTLKWTWTPTTTGDYTLTINADRNNEITETNEANNIYTQTVTITDTRPDITITDVTGIPENPVAGQTYTVTVTVANTGNSDASSFNVKFAGNGTQRITSLAAGTTTTLTWTWTPVTGTNTININTDRHNEITEANENNNIYTQTKTIN